MLGLFAPLLGKADHVPYYLPLLVFGAFGLLGALVALRLPETAGLKLPVTPGVSIPHHYKLKVEIIKTMDIDNRRKSLPFVDDD